MSENLIDVVRYSNDIEDSLGESFKNIEDKYKEDENKVIQSLAEQFLFLYWQILLRLRLERISMIICFHVRLERKSILLLQKKTKKEKAKEILKQFGEEEVVTASRTSQKYRTLLLK